MHRGGSTKLCGCRMIEDNHGQLCRVGCGQRIVWVAPQAIRATSLMSGVSQSSHWMGTPDCRTIA